MSFLSHPEIIGFAGVALLLVAIFLNLFRLLSPDSVLYLALNLIGAGLACASSTVRLAGRLLGGRRGYGAGAKDPRATAPLETQKAPHARSLHVHGAVSPAPRLRAGQGIKP